MDEVSHEPIDELEKTAPDDVARFFTVRQVTGTSLGPEGQDKRPIATAPNAATPVVPGFEIVGVLGRGAMGVVYEARHLALKRVVALKMILSGGHAGEVERLRFWAEAEAVARLQHPNIVQVHEVGEHEGLPYAALEFVEGGTFAQRLKRGPVSPREAAEVIATLAGAMHLAHTRNIIHRDLKPANILLDANGSPKVTDFGLARQLDSDIGQTQTGTTLGTPSYMSPEQAAGESKHVGPAADVYALGAILYECLTGRPPFQASSIVATLDMVRSQQPVAPHLLRAGVPADLETICLKCLRKEPEKRYSSADSLADDLRRWQRGEPIRARPVPLWEQLLLWAWRRPALAALVVLVHLCLAALLGLGIWSYTEINRALADANAEKLKSQRMSAGLALDRGLQLSLEGKVTEGLLWMPESLAVNPEEDRGFADLVRLNLAAWRATMTVQRSLIGHEGWVTCVAYSPDGATYATAVGNSVRRRDALTGEPVGQALVHSGEVLAMAFSPDGRLLATGTDDKSVRIWDIATGTLSGPPIPQPDFVNSVEFSPDGRWLLAATGYPDYSVASSARVWEVAGGKPVSPPLPHPATIRGGVFTPDGGLAITGAYDGLIRFWDTSTWKLSGEPIKTTQVVAMALSRDGLYLAVACNSNEAFVYSVPDRRLVSSPMRHPGLLKAIGFHPDGGLVATGCEDSLARLWDWSPGKQVGPPLLHQNSVIAVDFSPDGRRVITGSEDKLARIWDLPLHALTAIPLTQSDPALTRSSLDPSLVSGRPRTRITGDRGRPIPHWVWEYLCASFSPDGRYVVTGSTDNSARVWEVATGRLIGKPLLHDNWVRTVAFAPDNQHVLTGSHDNTAQLWDIHTGERAAPTLHHARGIVSVAVSPDGTRALTGSGDKTARLWNLQTGQPIGPPMRHVGEVLSVSFSDDGALALTGTLNGEVVLWDSATALPIGPPALHEGAVTSVRFADDRRSFLTLCDDGAARRWPLPQPVAGDPALVKLWVQTITGEQQDTGKAGLVLDAPAWRERRAQVMGSPLAADLEPGADAILSWHDGMAGAFEVAGPPGAALSHLDWLSKARPTDWSLHARRAAVLHRSSRDAEARGELDRARELGGLESARGWCAQRAENLERVHRHEASLWFHDWIVAADPKYPESHDAIGHCKARLGRFAEASDHFTRAVTLAPDRIGYRRDLAMARLALDDQAGYRNACARMIELAEATEDPGAAQMTALTCVLEANTVPQWDAVIRLAVRAAEGYDGDSRIHVAALLRAGRLAEALQRPWSKQTKYSHIGWEWLFQCMLHHQAGRREEARSILEDESTAIDHMDQEMPRDPKSKIWSDWIYYVQCHLLRKEAEDLLRRDELRKAMPPG
ncbi:protein kinase domain-containing protein [Aquisphaera insulae]|uniref:protein kinase domain-containing protein n=1 Tax=Aquisphaera insulae TaxID=2712864 RepID=UPI0013E9B86E|nr:protein kinase [Aquisphaera insulae]